MPSARFHPRKYARQAVARASMIQNPSVRFIIGRGLSEARGEPSSVSIPRARRFPAEFSLARIAAATVSRSTIVVARVDLTRAGTDANLWHTSEREMRAGRRSRNPDTSLPPDSVSARPSARGDRFFPVYHLIARHARIVPARESVNYDRDKRDRGGTSPLFSFHFTSGGSPGGWTG